MAMITCKECGKEISDKAAVCPNCGAPVLPEEATKTEQQTHEDLSKRYRQMSRQTKPCKHCKTEIPINAKVCPNCHKKQGGKFKWVIISFVILIIIGSAMGSGDNNTDQVSSNLQEDDTIKNNASTLEQEVSEAKNDTVTENIPTEYKSALKRAKNYSDLMHMSKLGIYDQLTSEYGDKFSSEAAQYAVDNVDADWNANALASAKNYSDTMHMSKKGIYDQLISEYGEQFTEEEAQYAVDHIDADWNANALEKAKTYQETMSMSPAAIHDQLTSEYGEQFTKDEADYAIANLE